MQSDRPVKVPTNWTATLSPTNGNSTCLPSACISRSVGGKSLCSSNLDCECFTLTNSATTGICAVADLVCSNVIRCNLDNITCSTPNTICVNNTRCHQPVFYSLAFASTQLCPP
ncbi:unnamed protein product [Didymodactylos carnosus]|uniref:Uncharacterized protein n=1 Tax=Didymodactylos carnosus TaxID=1234261 RepID=A0A814TAJ0_9BILA|nr:unnamed protein product [Didymodactylos carnosus]CAF1293153.1 unnamed protein product [Didymodactylos carnosus]CAF3922887.1 unnamed protein product [Didymodactylos carnosus]CAF4098101.1 unnamed protein product [Didymodactylos carnosus]